MIELRARIHTGIGALMDVLGAVMVGIGIGYLYIGGLLLVLYSASQPEISPAILYLLSGIAFVMFFQAVKRPFELASAFFGFAFVPGLVMNFHEFPAPGGIGLGLFGLVLVVWFIIAQRRWKALEVQRDSSK